MKLAPGPIPSSRSCPRRDFEECDVVLPPDGIPAAPELEEAERWSDGSYRLRWTAVDPPSGGDGAGARTTVSSITSSYRLRVRISATDRSSTEGVTITPGSCYPYASPPGAIRTRGRSTFECGRKLRDASAPGQTV